MVGEHWQLDDGEAFFEEDNPSRDLLIEDAIFCCKIEGTDWNDLMTKYHIHMGWEPHQPMSDDESEDE